MDGLLTFAKATAVPPNPSATAHTPYDDFYPLPTPSSLSQATLSLESHGSALAHFSYFPVALI
jgi:hypothetical protein